MPDAALAADVSEVAPPGTGPGPDGLGLNIHFTDPRPGEMKMIADGGFRWVRMDLTWQDAEPARGQYDFSPYDRLLSAGRPYGTRFMLILDYGNRLYEAQSDTQTPWGWGVRTEEGRAAMARWAAAAVKRYKGRGILWEMWNEPNHPMFWKPKPNVKEYIALARAVGQAIRQVAPGEMYAGPATAGIDFDFLEACFQAGLLDYWSAVTVHPYRQGPPETVEGEYRRLRQLIARYTPKGRRVPVISGEWGYEVRMGGSAEQLFPVSEQEHGKYLARQWLLNLANDVSLSIWYDWGRPRHPRADSSDGHEAGDPFGLVGPAYHQGRDPVYDPKGAYSAARTLTTALAGFRFRQRLATGRDEDHVLLFARGQDIRIAAWTTAPKPHRVVIPGWLGRFRSTGCLGEAMPAIEGGADGLPLILTDAPQYLAPMRADPSPAPAACENGSRVPGAAACP